ncbi:MAG: DUF2061 domain-containing protein [Planctomycetota bacterium]|jgi:uncharacterized membrane protein
MKDNSKAWRSLVKGVSWESFSFFLTIAITYWYLQSFSVSLKLTSMLFVIKIVCFFVHERIWHQIKLGKTFFEDHNV